MQKIAKKMSFKKSIEFVSRNESAEAENHHNESKMTEIKKYDEIKARGSPPKKKMDFYFFFFWLKKTKKDDYSKAESD